MTAGWVQVSDYYRAAWEIKRDHADHAEVLVMAIPNPLNENEELCADLNNANTSLRERYQNTEGDSGCHGQIFRVATDPCIAFEAKTTCLDLEHHEEIVNFELRIVDAKMEKHTVDEQDWD